MIEARTGERPDAEVFAPLAPRLTLLADDLLWWAVALATARAAST